MKQSAPAFEGVEGPLLPSFSADFRRLDADAVRRDVELGVAQGFRQLLCTADAALVPHEVDALVEIAATVAAGRLDVGVGIGGDAARTSIEILGRAARSGAAYGVVGVPLNVDGSSVEALAGYFAEVDRSCGLPLFVRITPEIDLAHVHPSGVPAALFDRLVDLPHVVGLRLETRNSAAAFELFERYGRQVQVTVTDFFSFPLLHRLYGMSWWAGWLPDVLQTPERPYVVELHELLRHGEIDAAMELYWRLVPLYRVVDRELARLGALPYVAYAKFCQGLAGGSGGPARESAARITDEQRAAIVRERREIGLESGAAPRAGELAAVRPEMAG